MNNYLAIPMIQFGSVCFAVWQLRWLNGRNMRPATDQYDEFSWMSNSSSPNMQVTDTWHFAWTQILLQTDMFSPYTTFITSEFLETNKVFAPQKLCFLKTVLLGSLCRYRLNHGGTSQPDLWGRAFGNQTHTLFCTGVSCGDMNDNALQNVDMNDHMIWLVHIDWL